MIQGVILEVRDKRFPRTLHTTPLAKRQNEKYQSKLVLKKEKESSKTHADVVEIDEDFGMLFDWVTHLDEKDLGDFHEMKGMATY